MNATFRKVLWEVLIGLLITKSNMKRGNGRIRRKRWPGTKWFWVRVDLRLGAMPSLSEREKERQETQSQPRTKKKKKRWVCMKYAWTCGTIKEIASWDQPNSNLAAHKFQQTKTHLNAWNIMKMIMEWNAWSYSIK